MAKGVSAFAMTLGLITLGLTAGWLVVCLAPELVGAAWETLAARRRDRRERLYRDPRRPVAIMPHTPSTKVDFRQHPDTRGWDLYVDDVFLGALALTAHGREMVEKVWLPHTESTRRYSR